jgi:hypothetical protein
MSIRAKPTPPAPAVNNNTEPSEVTASSTTTSKRAPAAPSTSASRPLTANINYVNKPPSDLSSNFKCVVLAKSGKRCRKKLSNAYQVTLVSTKLLFVKEGKNPKLEFVIDFKGGKCFKFEFQQRGFGRKGSSDLISKDTNNNLNMTEKERVEVIDLIGSSKFAFIVRLIIYFFLFT